MVATLTQGANAKAFTLDPSMRLRQATDTTSGTETRRILNHYNDSGDTPSWINTSTDAGATWTWQRNITGIDGDLAILQSSTGTPQIQLTNPHGDIIATLDDTTAATGPNATFENTEYGAPRPQNTTNPQRYGWLGGKQRSDDALAGVTLMGVRLYNPTTGRFLSTDPVPGGNDNAYDYPNDPVNSVDLNGDSNWGPHQRHWCYGHAAYCAIAGSWDVKWAEGYAKKVHDKYHLNWIIADAFQHFLWMAEVAFRVGRRAALALGRAHEKDTKNNGGPDRIRDLLNNSLGASVGASTHSFSIFGARKHFVNEAWRYFRAHRLWCIRGSGVANCHG